MDIGLILKIVGVGILVAVSASMLNKSGRDEQAMLVTLAASLAGLPLGNKFLHTAAGGAFVGGVLQHLLAHRKAL